MIVDPMAAACAITMTFVIGFNDLSLWEGMALPRYSWQVSELTESGGHLDDFNRG